MAFHPELLEIERGGLLQGTLVVVVLVLLVVGKVDLIVHAVPRVQLRIGTPGVFINVPRCVRRSSPLKRAAGRGAVGPGLPRGGRGHGSRLPGEASPLGRRRCVRRGERVVYIPVGQRYPERGDRGDDAAMAAAVAAAQSGGNVAVAGALARCHRGRHIFQNVQRRVTHALADVLVVELVLSGERPYSLRGLPDVHP